jgi:hypothetical protein
MDANDFYSNSSATPAAISPLSEIKDTSTRAIVARTPYFLSLLCALWGVSLRVDNRRKAITT